jgi:hypothetical protein
LSALSLLILQLSTVVDGYKKQCFLELPGGKPPTRALPLTRWWPLAKNVGALRCLHFSTYFLEIACYFKTYWKPWNSTAYNYLMMIFEFKYCSFFVFFILVHETIEQTFLGKSLHHKLDLLCCHIIIYISDNIDCHHFIHVACWWFWPCSPVLLVNKFDCHHFIHITGWWFVPVTPVSSANKTDRHDTYKIMEVIKV